MKISFGAKIATIAILANIVVANFAFAQQPAPPAPPSAPATGQVLNKQALDNAQASIENCKTFKDLVFNVSNREAKAIWTTLGNRGKCSIVPANYPDEKDAAGVNILGDSSAIPISYGVLEAQIRNGQGITNQQWIEAQKEQEERSGFWGTLSELVGGIIWVVADFITIFISFFTALAGWVFTVTLNMVIEVRTMPPFVDIGWTVVRDICNMMFILIMIVIAMAAILRIESYDYRHLLGEVVIMAILVNFSQVIAVTIMNFTNMIVAILAPEGIADIVAFIWSFIKPGELLAANAGAGSAVIQGLGKIAFAFVSLVSFLALAGLMVVRLVGLYVLIIFSPIAYAMDILPATKNFAHQWWHKFIEYLLWAPVAMFMLRLVIIVAEQSSFATNTGGGTFGDDSAYKYIVLTALMFATVLIAHHAGMVGGNAIVNAAEHTLHGAQHMVTGYAGRRWNEMTLRTLEGHNWLGSKLGEKSRMAAFAVLNPVAAMKGSSARGHELSHMAQEEAAAGGREVMEQFWTTGKNPFKPGFGKAKLKIPYRQFIARKDEDMFLKDYGNMKKESLMRAAIDAEGMEGFEGEARKRAIVKAAAANGYLDDLLRMRHFAEQYGEKDGTIYSAEVLNRFLYGYLGDNEQAKRFMAEDMENLGAKTKHYEYMGHAYFNNDEGKWERGMKVVGKTTGIGGKEIEQLDNDWQASYAVGEFGKLGGRDRVGAAPHNFTAIRAKLDGTGNIITDIEENPDGTFSKKTGEAEIKTVTFGRKGGDFDKFNTGMLGKMDADVMREVQHAQARVKTWLLSDELDVNSNGTIVLEDKEHFDELQKLYKIQPEFVKGLYTKVLKVRGDDRTMLDGIRVRIDGETDTRVISEDPNKVASGKLDFKYVDDPPSVSNPNAKASK